jgi:hypothetical protein
VGIRNKPVAGQGREPRKDNQEQHEDLENAQSVREPESPLREHAVQDHDECHARDSNGAGDPSVGHRVSRSKKDVAAESKGVAGREAEQDDLDSEDARG